MRSEQSAAVLNKMTACMIAALMLMLASCSGADGMVTMDNSLMALYEKGRITKDTLLTHCNNYEFMVKRVGR